jgi:16S rRNA processing protein RimM
LKKADLVSIGRVLRSQGNQGKLKLKLRERALPSFSPSRVYLDIKGVFEEYEVEAFERDRNSHFLKLNGVDSLSRADELAGLEVFVKESELPPLDDGWLYQCHVIGSRVIKQDGSDVGTVKGILPAQGENLLVVDHEGKDIYIPLTPSICVKVDLEKREVWIDPPDGLLELNEI